VYKTAQKFNVNLVHSEQVAAFALQLFDQSRTWLHNWGEEERELLWSAAILHNCGHHINHAEHHKHSYYLVRNAELLGFTEAQIQAIANLARYHRKSGPKKKHDSYRNVISKRHRKVIDQLSPLLRLAVALDRRKIAAIDRIQLTQNPPKLSVYPKDPSDDCALELWSLDDKKIAFETTFATKLTIQLM
jgi:exopolyphosphatase / guanosine-5'-triphosphate,3'-diphosphate pyrophosphatase